MKREPITRDQAMQTVEGQILYKIIRDNFEHGLNMSPRVRKAMESGPCVLGSQTWIEILVTEIMRGEL